MNNDRNSSAPQTRSSRLFGRRIIKQDFQLKFSLWTFSLMVGSVFITWLIAHGVLNHFIKSNLIDGSQSIMYLRLINTVICFSSGTMLLVMYLVTLIFSHKIAGPIYRIERVLEKIKEGDISMNVRFRKGDQLRDVEELFNVALAGLRSKIREEKNIISALSKEIETVSKNLQQANHSNETEYLGKINQNIKNVLQNIRIDNESSFQSSNKI